MDVKMIDYSEKENLYYKAEIKKAISEFLDYTKSEDFMGIILRAQIYIENDLDILINKLLVHPEKINLQFFSAKLDAAYALGAIDEEWYGAFRKFNKLRSKYAHDFMYEFTENDYGDLISTLSKSAKEDYMFVLKQEEFFNKIIDSFSNTTIPMNLNLKLRVLLSELMLYIKQQHQAFAYLWKEINCVKQEQILDDKIELVKKLSSTTSKFEELEV
jgi:DNA-binding MltR family transcriptional regulator